MLTSFKREVDQRSGVLRLCYLNPELKGYFQKDRSPRSIEIFEDLEGADGGRDLKNGNNVRAVTELNPDIFQIRGFNGSSHSYVIKGDYMNVMIDSGSDQNFPVLELGLRQDRHKSPRHRSRHQLARTLRSHRRQSLFSRNCDDRGLSSSCFEDDYRRLLRDHVQGQRSKRTADAGASMAGKHDAHRSGQLYAARLSHAGSHFRLHFDHREHPRSAVFRRQRVRRRHALLHRRER